MPFTDAKNFVNEFKSIYNIQNNNNYKEATQPKIEENGDITQTFIPAGARDKNSSDVSIFVTQSKDGTRTVDFKYTKDPASGKTKNKDKKYTFSDNGKICEFDEELHHVLYKNDGEDISIVDILYNARNEYYYDYDENGKLLNLNSKFYSGDSLEESTTSYIEGKTKKISTTKKVASVKNMAMDDSKYDELEYLSEQSFTDGQLAEDIIKNSKNPKENRTLSYFYDNKGRLDKIYASYENTDENYIESYEYYDDRKVKTIDRKKNDHFNFIQKGTAGLKSLLGDMSDFDKVETTYYNSLTKDTKYTYVEQK